MVFVPDPPAPSFYTYIERQGPRFPIGRYAEMIEYSAGCESPHDEELISFCIELEGVPGILQFSEQIYWALSEAGREFKLAKEGLRSGDALWDAGNFMLLRSIQLSLAKLYFDTSGKPAEDHFMFRLPEENLKRQNK